MRHGNPSPAHKLVKTAEGKPQARPQATVMLLSMGFTA